MAKKKKNIIKPRVADEHRIIKPRQEQDENITGYPVFRYDMIDREGPFAFHLARKDFNHRLVLEKIMTYSCMTWTDIRMQTHDRSNKSKHHPLEDASRLSGDAQERLKKMHREQLSDELFSFALTNKLRLIGYLHGDDFHVFWYDAEHGVYPSAKK